MVPCLSLLLIDFFPPNLIQFPVCSFLRQVKFGLIFWGVTGGREERFIQCFSSLSQSIWQLFQIFPFCHRKLNRLWLSLLFFWMCVCVCALALQIPLTCLPCAGVVRRSKGLHLPLPSRVQPVVPWPLLRANVHPLHPGRRMADHFRWVICLFNK